MRRIIVIGGGGAGKSTFSRELSRKLDIPLYHLDKIFQNKGWVGTPKEKFDEKIKQMY